MSRENVKEIVTQEDILKHVNGLQDQLVSEEKKNVISFMTLLSVVVRQIIHYKIGSIVTDVFHVITNGRKVTVL